MQLASPYPFPAKGQRPLIKDKLPGLMKNARFAVETQDLALAMLCAEEASHRATRTLKSVLAVLKAMDFPPQHLLDKVIKAARAVPKATPGEHHVYVILLYDPACEQPYGFYVGETSKKPKDRFAQHRRGYRAGKSAKKYGVCLSPALYEHVNTFAKEKAGVVERTLCKSLRKSGLWIECGSGPMRVRPMTTKK